MTDAVTQLELVMDRIEENRAAYLEQARFAAKALINAGRVSVNVDDVREICPPPPSVDGRLMANIFRNKKEWELVDFTRSKRAHRAHIGNYRLKEGA
jgi:hypothetical protein